MSAIAAASAKRPRTASSSSSLTIPSDTSPSANPPHKASRILPSTASSFTTSATSSALSSELGPTSVSSTIPPGAEVAETGNHPILCNLPPTCNRRPTPIANTNDLERHYAMYHAHVCEVKGCGCVFPEARLLELHQTECHDPIAALRKDRNEKIFQCHIPAPACGRSFLTPKARRLHLIQAHAFPKQYFFAVTNKGIGGLLKRWGEGASLVRKEWKPREGREKKDMGTFRDTDDSRMDEDDDDDDDEEEEEEVEEDTKGGVFQEEEDEDVEPADLEATPRIRPQKIHSPQSSSDTRNGAHSKNTHTDTSALAGLTDSLNSLTLVPNSVRFGRGGKSGGFTNNQPRGAPRGKPRNPAVHVPPTVGGAMDVDVVPGIIMARGRGVPHRGRGRGRGRPGRGSGLV